MTFLLLTVNVSLGSISRLDIRQKAHLLLLLLSTKFLLKVHMTIVIQIVDWTFLTGFIELFDMFCLLWGLDILVVLDATTVLVNVATYSSFVDLTLSHRHALIKFVRWHHEFSYHSIMLLHRISTLIIFKFTIVHISLDILHRNSILRFNCPSRLSGLLLMLLWHLPNKLSLPHRLCIIFILSFGPFWNYLALILLRLL